MVGGKCGWRGGWLEGRVVGGEGGLVWIKQIVWCLVYLVLYRGIVVCKHCIHNLSMQGSSQEKIKEGVVLRSKHICGFF